MNKHEGEALKRSLEEYGAVEPAVVNQDGTIIGGHMRVQAAQALGWEEFPVVRVDLDDEKAQLLNLALNRIHGEWDEDKLAEMLWELNESDGDLALSGFDTSEVDKLLDSVGGPEREIPEPEEPPEDPITQPGELILLGEHRLLCGDATRREDLERLTEGRTFASCVTDPPYGIEQEGISNDDPVSAGGLYVAFLELAPLENAVIACFQSPRLVPTWLDAVREAGQRIERLLWLHRQAAKTYPWRGWILASDAIVLSSVGVPEWPEPIDHCHDTYVKTELEEAALTGTHTTIKPAWVCRDLIAKLPAGPILEPFAGSGTTLMAAEALGRECYALEIDPAYCDVIVKRWEQYTGKEAMRGRTTDKAHA